MPCSAVFAVQQLLLCENSKTDGREVVDGEAHILWMVLAEDRLTACVSKDRRFCRPWGKVRQRKASAHLRASDPPAS